MVVGAVITPFRTQYLERHFCQVETSSDSGNHHRNRGYFHLGCDLGPSGIGVLAARFPYLADRQALGQSDQSGDVVVVGVSGDHQAEAPHPIRVERLPEEARIRPAVDQHCLSCGRDEQRRIPLANIKKDHRRTTHSTGCDGDHQQRRGESNQKRPDARPMDGDKQRRRDRGDGSDPELGMPGGCSGDRQDEVGGNKCHRQKRSRSGDDRH